MFDCLEGATVWVCWCLEWESIESIGEISWMREKEQCVDEAVTALAKGKTLLLAAPRGAAPTQMQAT